MQGLFCGSFDPFTLGHYDIASRSSKLFDKLYIAVGVNVNKQRFLDVDTSLALIRDSMSSFSNVTVLSYDTLTVTLCEQLGVTTLIHGIRNATDLAYEYNIERINKSLNPSIDNIYLHSCSELSHISSSLVQELLRFNAPIEHLFPDSVTISKYISLKK